MNARSKFSFISRKRFKVTKFSVSRDENSQKIRVCVIGAGPSGISVARHLSENLNELEITVFEKSREVGGQWLYSDEPEKDEYGHDVHSSMYKYMR